MNLWALRLTHLADKLGTCLEVFVHFNKPTHTRIAQLCEIGLKLDDFDDDFDSSLDLSLNF